MKPLKELHALMGRRLGGQDQTGVYKPNELPFGTVVGCLKRASQQYGDYYVYDPALNHPNVESWYIKAPRANSGTGTSWQWVQVSPGRFRSMEHD